MKIGSNLAVLLHFFPMAHHPFDLRMDRGVFLDLPDSNTVSLRSYMEGQALSMWDERAFSTEGEKDYFDVRNTMFAEKTQQRVCLFSD